MHHLFAQENNLKKNVAGMKKPDFPTVRHEIMKKRRFLCLSAGRKLLLRYSIEL